MTPLPRAALPLPDPRPEVLRAILRGFDPAPPSSARVRELALCSPGRLAAPSRGGGTERPKPRP